MRLYADIPVWLIPIFITAVLLYTGYRFIRQNNIHRWLHVLRATIWILLLLAVANPWLRWQKEIERLPRVGIWVDRSLSIPTQSIEALKNITSKIDSTEFIYYDLNTRKPLTAEQLYSVDTYTDYSNLEKKIPNVEEEWLLSDGNSNRGKRDVSIPISRQLNVLLSGDTLQSGDLAILDAIAPAKMYLNKRDTLKLYISSSGFSGLQNGWISIFSNGRNIHRSRFAIAEQSERQIKIPLKYQSRGNKKLEIKIENGKKDANPLNNVRFLQINVEPRQKVLLLIVGYPIPEIRYFRYFLNERNDFLVKQGIENFFGKGEVLPDAIITFAYPFQNITTTETGFWQRAFEKNIPVIFFSHEKINFFQLEKMKIPLLVDLTAAPEILPLELVNGMETNTVINPGLWPADQLQRYLSERSPVVRDFRLRLSGKNTVLLKGIRDLPEQGFLSLSSSKRRRIALFAGWNSYLLHTSALSLEVYPLWKNVINTLLDWITAPPLSAGIYHNMPDTLIQNIGSNILDIQIVDDFGENVSNAVVSFNIRNADWRYENTAARKGLNYSAEIPYMPVGAYHFSISALWGRGEKMVKDGQFFVANIGPEKLVHQRNENYIRSFAHGRILPIEKLNKNIFYNKRVKEMRTKEIYLFPGKWILLIVLPGFLLDIYLRKRFHIL